MTVVGEVRDSLKWIGDIFANVSPLFRCPNCPMFPGKVRCPKYCELGYLRAAVGEHTSVVPIEDIEIEEKDKNNAFLKIKKVTLHNSGKRKGTYIMNVVAKSLGEEIGSYTKNVELKPTEKKEIKGIEVSLPKFSWLRNDLLDREPSRSDFEVEVFYEILDKGDKCDACINGFNKCYSCWKGYRFK